MNILLYGKKKDETFVQAIVTEKQLDILSVLFFGGELYYTLDQPTGIEGHHMETCKGQHLRPSMRTIGNIFDMGLIQHDEKKSFVRAGVQFSFYKLPEWLNAPLNHLAIARKISF